MPVASMTGFGRGEATQGNRTWAVEMRCVNHRYLDLKIRVPKGYTAFEDKIRKSVSTCHQRGRIDLSLTVSGNFADLVNVRTNVELAKRYKKTLTEMAEELDMSAEIDLRFLTSFPEVLVTEQGKDDVDQAWPVVSSALEAALSNCSMMRTQEGEQLVEDLNSRVNHFSSLLDHIEGAIPQLLQQREESLKERLEKLLGNVQLDPMRLAQEVAIMADKTDVTEEIVRLKSHISQFKKFLGEDEAVGRKLDFLIQEFLREVNTMASKISDATIAHLTVEMKGELEKMREQVQNIE